MVLQDEYFKAANLKATQTVEILAFVDRESIPPLFFERPYRLAPGKRGEKGYALLRETLKRTNKVGVAQVVIRNRQHLSLLMPMGDLLELITLRYADEVLGAEDFELPSLKDAKVTDKEVQLAERLVEDMTEEWNPRQYRDTYRDDLMKRIEALATQGRTKLAKAPANDDDAGGAKVIDLMAALKRSLESKGGPRSSVSAAPRPGTGDAKAPKRAPAAKRRATKSVKGAARKRA